MELCAKCAIFVYITRGLHQWMLLTNLNNMCVIIVKQNDKQLSRTILRTASTNNPHGLGVVFLDTFEVSYHKSKDWKKLVTNRPFIAHFRFATKGKINKANTHPFVCGKNKHELHMHNGTIPFLGNDKDSDSKLLAKELGEMPRHTWKEELSVYDSRFVTINTRTRRFQRYNKSQWTNHKDTFYSNDRPIKDNLVAVYGTLKKGYGNYHSYLMGETHVGSGKTIEKYPMVIDGLPWVIDKPGEGNQIEIDLFAVSDKVMRSLDGLEGHPVMYKRKKINVLVKGRKYSAWLYFGQNQTWKGKKLHKSYNKKPSSYFYHNAPRTFTFADAQPYTPAHRLGSVEADTHWWEDSKKLSEKESICPDCFQQLDYDGWDKQYYCHQCTQYFSKEEVQKFRI